MALMQSLREKTHVVMIILVVAFVALIGIEWGADYAGRGASSQSAVGVINGQKISYEEMRAEYEQLRRQETEKRGGSLDEMRDRQILNDIWNRKTEFILLKQEIEKRGISVTDAELIEAIRMNPPEFLKNQEIFQTDGRFDQAKYLQVLNNPNVEGLEVIEDQYRALLPTQKLVDRLRSIVHVTDTEVRRSFMSQNEKLSVKYILFDPNSYASDPVTLSDSEIKSFYEKNKADYEQDKRMKLEYILLLKQPNATDSLRVVRQITDLHQQLTAGADFEKLAKSFSEDPGSASRGGDLGFFKHGDMVAAFDSVAYNTPIGQVSEPLLTQFGWHIIKVDEKKMEGTEEQVHARHILLKTAVGQETLNTLRKKMQTLLDKAKTSGFQEAVKSVSGVTLENTGYFTERPDGFMPRLGYVMGAGSFTEKAQPGAYSDILENDNAYYLLRFVDRKEKGLQDLAEVKTQIQSQLTRDKHMEKSKEEAERVKRLLGGGNLDNLTGTDAARVITLEPFAREGFIPGIGQDMGMTGAAFRLTTPGQMSDMVKGDRGYYLIQLVSRQPIDEAVFAAQKAAIREQLAVQQQTQLYTDWIDDLRGKATIENNLGVYFTY